MATPPSLPTNWTDSSLRLANLKNAINDLATAVNQLGAAGLGGWSSWTPALTATTSNPNFGAHGVNGCVIAGRYTKIGRLVVAVADLRAATTGVTAGTGDYRLSTPVQLSTASITAGMSSGWAGVCKLYRGYSTLDLGVGAHLEGQLHVLAGGNTLALTFEPGAQGGNIERTTVTSSTTAIGTSSTDVTSASVSVTPLRRGARYRIKASAHVLKEAGSQGEIYLDLCDGANTVLRRRVVTAITLGTVGFATGLLPVDLEYIDESPTVGTAKTYKLRAQGLDGTCAVFGNSSAPIELTAEELPASSQSGLTEGSDYVTAEQPWRWSDQSGASPGRPQIWGLILAESAA